MPKFIATAEFDSQEINSKNRSELVNPGDEVEIGDQGTIDRLTANGWIKSAEDDVVTSEPTGAADGSVADPQPSTPAPTGLTTASLAGNSDDQKDPVPA